MLRRSELWHSVAMQTLFQVPSAAKARPRVGVGVLVLTVASALAPPLSYAVRPRVPGKPPRPTAPAGTTTPPGQAAGPTPAAAPVASRPAPPPELPPPGPAREFLPEAQALFVAGACGQGPAPAPALQKAVAKHCKALAHVQQQYRANWLAKAQPFFAERVPTSVPSTVVYPFAGGDLATALTVFPNAKEITTLSLEPAGDPRTLGELSAREIDKALAVVQTELTTLYRANYSVTMNMIGAMRAGKLPTQLIFSLSALAVHGYELVSLTYFTLADDGSLRYMSAGDEPSVPFARSLGARKRNERFGSVEIRFRKPGATQTQVYRHLLANLDDAHLKKQPGVLAYLQARGSIAAMTKAASYLMAFDSFATIRGYLLAHATWMVSDSTGVAPKWGTPAGFTYETYGSFAATNMPAGNGITAAWTAQYKAQPKRELPFRFGYPDRRNKAHLIIMHK